MLPLVASKDGIRFEKILGPFSGYVDVYCHGEDWEDGELCECRVYKGDKLITAIINGLDRRDDR